MCQQSVTARAFWSFAFITSFHVHCEYHGIEEETEQTGIVNLRWPIENGEQNEWTRINSDVTHQGEVWSYTCHRLTKPVSLSIQFSQVIASHNHHDEDTDPAVE